MECTQNPRHEGEGGGELQGALEIEEDGTVVSREFVGWTEGAYNELSLQKL